MYIYIYIHTHIYIHNISSNIAQGQIHVILCSTYLLNNNSYNTCFLQICFYREWVLTKIHVCKLL